MGSRMDVSRLIKVVAGNLILLAGLVVAMPAQSQASAQLEQVEWNQLERAMRESRDHAQTWSRGWSAFFAASAATNLYIGTHDGSDSARYDSRVRTVTSTLGLVETLINPPPHAKAYNQYRALNARRATDPNALPQARQLAADLMRTEQERQAWRTRLGALIVNTGAYFAIAEGDDRPGDALSVALGGLLVNEIKIRTQPKTFTEASFITLGNTAVPVYPQVYGTIGGIGLHVGF